MTNKIIRGIIFIAIIMLYFTTGADRWVNRTLPHTLTKVIAPLVVYLPILFLLC